MTSMNQPSAIDEVSWLAPLRFTFSGREYRYFFHYHNCGWPPSRCTERTVELALADRWLEQFAPEDVYEIGAVTPYYWPHRVRRVIDPSDAHKLVAHRQSVVDFDLRGRTVLSISTLEHIGAGQYGLEKNPSQAVVALRKVCTEARELLITVPVGYNHILDEALFTHSMLPADVSLRFLVRLPDGVFWRQEWDPTRARIPYGELWANSVAILERGDILPQKSRLADSRSASG
jgi:hypothetical protein